MKKFTVLIRFFIAAFGMLLLFIPVTAQEWENIQPMDAIPDTGSWRSRDAILDFCEIRQDPDYEFNHVVYINDFSYEYRRGSFRYDWRLNTELGVSPDEGNEIAGITMVFRAKPTTEAINANPDSTVWWWYVSIRASGPVGYHTEMQASKNGLQLSGCTGQIPLVEGEDIFYPLDTSWHTFRVTVIQRDVKIYMDENPEPIIETKTTCVDEGGNQLRVGKQDRSHPIGTLFDYFLILEGAIYAPGEGPAIPDGFLVGPGGSPVGLREAERGIAYSVYPNPTNGTLNLRFLQAEDGPVNMDIYSLAGQKLRSSCLGTFPAGSHEVRIHTGDLPGGIYLLSLNGKYTKFIKK